MPEKINVQSVIQAQMNQFYSAIAQEKENRVKVRNWQITILIAFIAYLVSNSISKINASFFFSFSMLTGIISIFWIVEAFYQSLVLAYLKRVGNLEKLLGNKTEVPRNIPLEVFFESGFYTISGKEKVILFLKACFLCKSIVLFNLGLISGVLILSLVLFR